MPKNWIKVSGTKAVSRFHSPQIVKFIQEREQQKESLGIECDRAYAEFLRYFPPVSSTLEFLTVQGDFGKV